MFVNVLNGQRMENVKGIKFTWKLSAEEAVAFVEGHYLFFFTLSIILWKLNKMSTGNSQNAKQRLIILCTTKSLTIIDLTCAIDFTPSPHKKKKKKEKKKKKQPEKALQTRYFVLGLHINCLSSSPNTFSIAVKIARYLVYKMSLVLCD